jgi:glutathione-independent formaldehyde dehydrogenase
MGPFRGGQAERLLVPRADFNCLKLPGQPGDELEDDFLLLSDIFPTAYHATELAQVSTGKTVAIFGAGPVGLLSAYCAILKGAAEVYVVDCLHDRLQKASSIGAIPIDFTKGDPVEQIKLFRKNNVLQQAAFLPGEEKMSGVMCGIDAVGYEAKSDDDPRRQKQEQVLANLAELVNATGAIGIIGVFLDEDPGGQDSRAKIGEFNIPLGKIWSKSISIGMGQCPVKKYNEFLRDLIISGRARPSFIVSHRVPLEFAPEAYQKFDLKEDGYTKVLIKPDLKSDQWGGTHVHH